MWLTNKDEHPNQCLGAVWNYLYLLCSPLLLTTVFATVGGVYVQDSPHHRTVTRA